MLKKYTYIISFTFISINILVGSSLPALYKLLDSCDSASITKADSLLSEYFTEFISEEERKSGEAAAHLLVEEAHQKFWDSKYHKAALYYSYVELLGQQYGLKKLCCHVGTKLSRTRYRLGNHRDAMFHANAALDMAQEYKFDTCMALAYREIAWNYYRVQDYEQAIINIKKTIPFVKKGLLSKDKLYNALGVFYGQDSQLDSSKYYLDKALATTKDRRYTAVVTSNLARTLTNLGHFEQAIGNYQKAIKTNREDNDLEQLGSNLNGLAVTLTKADKLDLVFDFIKESLKVSRTIGDNQRILEAYSTLVDFFKKKKQNSNELKYLYKYIALKDSLSGNRNLSEMIRIDWNRQIELSQNKVKLLQAQKELKEVDLKKQKTINNIILISGILGLLLLSITFYLVYQIIKRRDEATQEKLNRELVESEMSALRSQMNPHFLFNSLNSIKHFIIKNEAHLAADYLTKFAKLVRLTLSNSNKKLISINEEIEVLELYLLMEKLRLEQSFTSSIDVSGQLDLSRQKIPPMLIQPFVENAVWHGLLDRKNKDGLLNINFSIQGESLVCKIKDNGIGRVVAASKKKSSNKKSLGVKITKDRLDMINKIYAKKCTVHFTDLYDDDNEPNGTLVTITLPKSFENQENVFNNPL